MDKNISKEQILKWLTKVAVVMVKNKDYLTELDAAIGDADHGINMERGFKKVLEKVDGFSDLDVGSILKNTGLTLISSIGGASGPLYGTLFMQMGMALINKDSLNVKDLYQGIAKGVEGVQVRGSALAGEKTMIDVLEPVTQVLKASVEVGESLLEALPKVTVAAKKGMESTTSMIARKGRASYLGTRSIGHQDAGATSSYFIFKTLEEVMTPTNE